MRLPVFIGLTLAVIAVFFLGRSSYLADKETTAGPPETARSAPDAQAERLAATQGQAEKTASESEPARSAAEAARRAAEKADAEWSKARSGGVEALTTYLRAHPDSPHAPEVRATLEAARQAAEKAAQKAAAEAAEKDWPAALAGGAAALKAYLDRYPDGPRAAEARAALDAARQSAEKAAAEAAAKAAAKAAAETDWATAQAGGAAALKAYLDRYPDGPRAAEARAALDGLARRPVQARASNRFVVVEPPRAGDRKAIAHAPDAAARGVAPAGSAKTIGPGAAKAAAADRQPLRRKPERPQPTLAANGEKIIRIAQGAARRPKFVAARPAHAAPIPPHRRAEQLFPAEAPRASASYEIAPAAFAGMKTYGEATKFVLAALAAGGYVEKSVFKTEDGGLAIATRLERIGDDGTPEPGSRRWALDLPPDGAVLETLALLNGRVSLPKGRYRSFVLVLHDRPGAPAQPASARPAAGTRCETLVYEFLSDGAAVRLVENGLPARDHLARAGLLAALEKR